MSPGRRAVGSVGAELRQSSTFPTQHAWLNRQVLPPISSIQPSIDVTIGFTQGRETT